MSPKVKRISDVTTLYGKHSSGVTLKVWSIAIAKDVEDDQKFYLMMQYGKEGGKMTDSLRPILSGKNVGKANETSIFEQSQKELASRIEKQIKAGYRKDKSQLDSVPIKPMLAVSYHDWVEKRLADTLYLAQPKLNGVRCLVHRNGDTLTFQSRGGIEYTSLNLHTFLGAELLNVMPEGAVWDGEIYRHGWSLQQIASAVKDFGDDTLELEFWAYDTVETSVPCVDRLCKLVHHIPDELEFVKLCPTETISGSTEIFDKKFQEYLDKSYEGLILRQYNGTYQQGLRSKYLVKRKKFEDKEYKISGFYSDVDGCIIFSFFNAGKPFNAVPAWGKDERKKAYQLGLQDTKAWVGKYATVSASDISDDNIPIGNPTVVCVRDYE